jgi:hypothetical protein
LSSEPQTIDREDSSEPLLQAEQHATAGRHAEALAALRTLSLPAFGRLLLDVPADKPALRSWLPRMPSDAVQRAWTGSAGEDLLVQSCAFMTSLQFYYERLAGRSIAGARMLDYGCGWGRLMRLALWMTDPDRLYGIDPWDQSIALCREHGVLGQLAIGDYLPRSLPVQERFDLVYCFSVFTHLSERAADSVLETLLRHILPDGVVAITIRPVDYWQGHGEWPAGHSRDATIASHRDRGFAFVPHVREAVDGDVTYGDTSMTVEFLDRRWPDWRVSGVHHNVADPLQILVFLTPRPKFRGLVKSLLRLPSRIPRATNGRTGLPD